MKSLGSKSKELDMKMLEHSTMNVSRFRILLNINGSLKKIRQNHA
jgi:hypothetical protein